MGRCNVLFACCPTPQLLLKLGHVWIISLILCMLSALSSTGMLEKEWKKESSLKLVRTWLPSRRIMKKLAWIPLKVKMKEKNTEVSHIISPTKDELRILDKTQNGNNSISYSSNDYLSINIFPDYF